MTKRSIGVMRSYALAPLFCETIASVAMFSPMTGIRKICSIRIPIPKPATASLPKGATKYQTKGSKGHCGGSYDDEEKFLEWFDENKKDLSECSYNKKIKNCWWKIDLMRYFAITHPIIPASSAEGNAIISDDLDIMKT